MFFLDGVNCDQDCSYNFIHKGIRFSNLAIGESLAGILHYNVDFTLNNNTSNVPQEDDEAVVTTHPNSGGGGKDALDVPIDQATTLALYQLFPVPAIDKLQVVFGTVGYQVNLFLYDVHGKQIRHQSLQIMMRGENAIEVDVESLTAGFYTISLETPEGFVRGKFLKQ